jgi:hypothetical protein
MNPYLKTKSFIVLFFAFPILIFAQTEDAPKKKTYYYNGIDYATLDKKDSAEGIYNKNNYEVYFMPGLAYSFYQPKLKDDLGYFHGLAIEYLIFAQVHRNDNPGPSDVRVYAKLNLMQSSKKSVSDLFV